MPFISPGIRREAAAWIRLSIPATLRGISENLPSVLALVFVGRLGTSELAAVSISDVWMYSTASIVWMGLGSTQAALISQAHGAGHIAAARGWGFISFGLNLLGALLCAAWWALTDPVLNALSLDSHLDRTAVRAYSLWSITSLLPIALNTAVSSQLVSLQLPLAPMLVEAVTCLVDIPAMYILVLGVPPGLRGYGVEGSAMAMFISQVAASVCYVTVAYYLLRGRVRAPVPEEGSEDVFAAAATVATVTLEEPLLHSLNASESRGGDVIAAPVCLAVNAEAASSVEREGAGTAKHPQVPAEWLDAPWSDTWAFCAAPHNWCTFLGQAGGACASVALELWQLQIISFMAASLGPVDIATHNAMLTLFELISTLLYGMGEALSVRVGYHLGRRSIAEAKRVCAIAFSCAFFVSVLLAIAMTGSHSYVGRIFSDDPAVIAMASKLIFLSSCAYVMLALCMMALSTLQGQSRTTTMAVTFVVGCWCVCIPLAFTLLEATHLGIFGLWASLLSGYSVATVIAVIAVVRSDWAALAEAAAERLSKGTGDSAVASTVTSVTPEGVA